MPKGDLTEETNFTVAPTDGAEIIQSHPEEEKDIAKGAPTEEGELTPECDKVSKVMQDNQHLHIMHQNGCQERGNLSPSSKDDTVNNKDE